MGNQELYKSATTGKAGDMRKTSRTGLGQALLTAADLYWNFALQTAIKPVTYCELRDSGIQEFRNLGIEGILSFFNFLMFSLNSPIPHSPDP